VSAYSNEELRVMLVKAERTLRAVYELHGPGGTRNRKLAVNKFAAMTTSQVDERYDFYDRHLMHRVAKVLADMPPIKTWSFWCWRTSSDAEGKVENTNPTGAAIYWRKRDGGEGRKVKFICFKD
jgi:hypothetical protein